MKRETEGAAQEEIGSRLQRAIEKGLEGTGGGMRAQLLEEREPLEIVQGGNHSRAGRGRQGL